MCARQREGQRTYYLWRVYGDRAIALIHLLKPHLWEKLPQAELLLAIRSEPAGEKREGLIRQLTSMKHIDYRED